MRTLIALLLICGTSFGQMTQPSMIGFGKSSYSPASINSAIIAYYHMDETTGHRASVVGGSSMDLIPTVSVTYTTSGVVGNAAVVNVYNSNMTTLSGTAAVTSGSYMTCWVKITGTDASGSIVGGNSNYRLGASPIFAADPVSHILVYQGTYITDAVGDLISDGTVGSWHFLAIGISTSGFPIVTYDMNTSTSPWTVSADRALPNLVGYPSTVSDFQIDEYAIYNRNLTVAELQYIYKQGRVGHPLE